MRQYAFTALALLAGLGLAMADAPGQEGWAVIAGPTYEAGLGIVADMTAHQAVYFKGSTNSGPGRRYLGTLERRIPLSAWRGQRLRLSLRLRNEGVASTAVTMQINKTGGAAIRSPAATKWTTGDSDAWRLQTFVLDVPDDASELVLDVSMRDKGMVWLDELKLQAVGTDVPLSNSARVASRGGDWSGIYGGGAVANTDNLAPDPQAYAPLVNGSFTVGATPVTPPGATPRP